MQTNTSKIDSESADVVQVRERFVFTETTNKKLDKQAQKQAQKLDSTVPQERYGILKTSGNDGSKPEAGFLKETGRRIKNFFTK